MRQSPPPSLSFELQSSPLSSGLSSADQIMSEFVSFVSPEHRDIQVDYEQVIDKFSINHKNSRILLR